MPISVRFLTIVAISACMSVLFASPASAYTVQGAIKVEYDQLGGANFFGNPLFDERNAAENGKFQSFSKGSSIYWHSYRTGSNRARQIGGLIRDKWGTQNYENGWLGYPTTRETATRKPGRFNHFEHGSIYWSSATGAHPVAGQIYSTWAANDWENGSYGFPTSDEYAFEGGRRQDFQGGSIVYQPGGFPVDWAGDEDGTDTTPECGDATSNCGIDGVGNTLGAQNLPVLAPGPLPSGRSARTSDPCATTPAAVPTTGNPTSQTPDGTPEPSTSATPTPRIPGRAPAATTTSIPSSSSTTTVPNGESGDTPASSTPSGSSSVPDANRSTSAESTPQTTEPQTPSTTSSPSTSTPVPGSTPPSAPSTSSPSSSAPPQSTGVPEGSYWCRRDGDLSSVPQRPSARAQRALGENASDPMCTTGNVQRKWKGNRQRGCYQNYAAAFDLRDKDGKIIGTITAAEYVRVLTTWNKNQWTVVYQLDVISATGRAAGAVMSLNSSCVVREGGSGCLANGDTTDSTTAAPGNLLRTDIEFTSAAPAGAKKTVQALHTLQFNSTTPEDIPYSGQVQSARVRCDAAPKMRNTQGCVIADAIPAWDIRSTAGLDAYRDHVSLAHLSGLPGFANNSGDGETVLTRLTDQAAINVRRNITCGGVTGPRTGGRSCDEYPMASTYQGGGNGTGAGLARTFRQSLCGIRDDDITELTDSPGDRGPGYSVCLIPASQNSRAGSLQSWFYTKSRVLDGDSFRVRAK